MVLSWEGSAAATTSAFVVPVFISFILSFVRPALVLRNRPNDPTGLTKVAPYSASKHALHGFFDSLRIELKVKCVFWFGWRSY